MRRSVVITTTCLLLTLFISAFAAAGTGLKIESQGFDKYTAAGVDLELGLPGIPVRPITELMGWWGDEGGQVGHFQAGIGVRLYLENASRGPFLEAKMRYIMPLEFGAEASSLMLVGVGYRIRPIVGGLDVYVAATGVEHDIIPKYVIGARAGF